MTNNQQILSGPDICKSFTEVVKVGFRNLPKHTTAIVLHSVFTQFILA